jgi:hypothetical protein
MMSWNDPIKKKNVAVVITLDRIFSMFNFFQLQSSVSIYHQYFITAVHTI